MMIKQDIALLEHRLTSNETQRSSSSDLIHRMIDDIDAILGNSSITVKGPSIASSPPNEINRLQVLKRDIIHQAINSSHGMTEMFNAIIQKEQNRFLLKNRFMESTSEWQQAVSNAIENRRLHMIDRSNFIIAHRLATSFKKNSILQNKQTISNNFEKDEYESHFISFSTTNAN